MKNEMTSKDRVKTALSHKETDRIPFSLGFGLTWPALQDLSQSLDHESPQQTLLWLQGKSDIRSVQPDYIGPTDRNTSKAGGSIDVWGVERCPVVYGTGYYDEICYYPLAAVKDISGLDKVIWPSADWFSFDNIKEKIKALNTGGEYCIQMSGGNIFETAWYMRGFEQMLADIILEPELCNEIMTRVTDFFLDCSVRLLEAAEGAVDIVFTADDVGQQEGPIMSVGLWEEMIKPHHVRLNKRLKEYGVKIMYHTDGAIMDFLPGLTEMGIDILEALQFDAKDMEPAAMKEKYGAQLCFHGGVSVQSTLPFGTEQDVRDEVSERIRVLGKDGGYILAPSHAIQAGTPPENILSFLQAADRL